MSKQGDISLLCLLLFYKIQIFDVIDLYLAKNNEKNSKNTLADDVEYKVQI